MTQAFQPLPNNEPQYELSDLQPHLYEQLEQHQYQQQQQQPQTQQHPSFYRQPSQPSPGTITLRREAPFMQEPAPTFTSQPAAASFGGKF